MSENGVQRRRGSWPEGASGLVGDSACGITDEVDIVLQGDDIGCSRRYATTRFVRNSAEVGLVVRRCGWRLTESAELLSQQRSAQKQYTGQPGGSAYQLSDAPCFDLVPGFALGPGARSGACSLQLLEQSEQA
jgi:hypothetical protein